MLNKNLVLSIIIGVAIFLRFWQLGSVPISLDWDEVSLGYNAYSILTTGRDEYGNFMPVMLKSFGDYKPALYSYFTIPSVLILGLNEFAVRLPSVIFGIISVIITYALVKELFKNDKLALASAFLLAISPWHLQFSRTAFEANLGVFLNLLTVLLFIKGLRKPPVLILSAFTSALSIYAYQSEKIFAPILMLILVINYHKDLLTLSKKYLAIFFAVGFLTAAPMLISIIDNPQSLNRIKSTSLTADTNFFPHTSERVAKDLEKSDFIGFTLDNRRVTYLRQSIGAYLSHFDPNWLFIEGDLPRHHAPYMGLLYHFELPFLLIGFYFLIFDRRIGRKTKILILSWFLVVPIPATVTNDIPHAVRTLNFLPTFQILIALGLIASYDWLKQNEKNSLIRNFAIGTGFVIAFFNFIYFFNQYFVQQNYFYSKDWQYGYKEAVDYVSKEKSNYEKIVVSNEVPLDQSYIFFLFYQKVVPNKYQMLGRGVGNNNFDNFEFRPIKWEEDRNLVGTLFVGRPRDFKEDAQILKTVDYVNREEAIRIVKSL